MRKFFSLFVLTILIAPFAHADNRGMDAWTNAKVNLRAGPDGGFPAVDILSRGEHVEMYGCLSGYVWCEVRTLKGERGWVYGHYLQINSGIRAVTVINSNGAGGLRIITFKPRNYWDTHYRKKRFYRDIDNYIPRNAYYYDDGGRGHHHHNNNNHWNDDDHGHHGGRPERPAKPPEVTKEPKYAPLPMSSRKKYNPLCDIGETEC